MYAAFWCEKLRERDHLEDPGVDWRILLRWVFRKWDRAHGLDLSGSQGSDGGTCECGNEPSGYIK